MILLTSSNITITVRGEQAGKRINYSDPALGNSTDCLVVDNYKYNDKDNIKLKDNNKDRDNYNDNHNDNDNYKDNVNANDKNKKNDKDKKNNNDKK